MHEYETPLVDIKTIQTDFKFNDNEGYTIWEFHIKWWMFFLETIRCQHYTCVVPYGSNESFNKAKTDMETILCTPGALHNVKAAIRGFLEGVYNTYLQISSDYDFILGKFFIRKTNKYLYNRGAEKYINLNLQIFVKDLIRAYAKYIRENT